MKPGVYVSPDLEARAWELGIAVTVLAELGPGTWVVVTDDRPKEGSALRRWLGRDGERLVREAEAAISTAVLYGASAFVAPEVRRAGFTFPQLAMRASPLVPPHPRAFRCPTCGARKYRRCVNAMGYRQRRRVHRARIEAARRCY